MSGKKTWATSLALLVGVLLIAMYAWIFRWRTHQQVTTHDGVRPHYESQISAPSATTHGAAMPAKQASSDVATYHNVRFDFAVDYPAKLLIAGEEADNGDGLQFASNASHADIRAYGGYNALEQTPKEMLQYNLKEDCEKNKVTYQVSKPAVVAYSCLSPAGRIVYEKIIIRDDTLATVRFDYDPHEQSRWLPVIKQMADSLRLGAGPAVDDARVEAR